MVGSGLLSQSICGGAVSMAFLRSSLILLHIFGLSGGQNRILLEKLCRIVPSMYDFSVFLIKSSAKNKTMPELCSATQNY